MTNEWETLRQGKMKGDSFKDGVVSYVSCMSPVKMYKRNILCWLGFHKRVEHHLFKIEPLPDGGGFIDLKNPKTELFVTCARCGREINDK